MNIPLLKQHILIRRIDSLVSIKNND